MAGDLPSDTSSRSPDNRLKAPMLESESISAVKTDHQLHGFNSKESAMAEDAESESCGICLSDGERLVRGTIDCCDHLFCFVCIMEWSKVESRCPLCKRRFTIIFRPAKLGVFESERVVCVPLRDQGNYKYGDASSRRANLSSQVQCSTCQSSDDKHLLVLCDLCDAASHTYCVGLGATVPEGDWFCHDCAIAKAERSRELDIGTENLESEPKKEVSIFDIVRESNYRVYIRDNSSLSPPPNRLSPTFVSGRESGVSVEVAGSCERPAQRIIVGKASESCVRALRSCHNMDSRVQALRENWHALRTGSTSFTSSLAESRGRANQGSPNFDIRLGESETSSFTSQRPAAPDSSASIMPTRDLYDVNKAWKMMRAANSFKSKHENAKSTKRPSRATLSLGKSSKEVVGSSSGVNLFEHQRPETRIVRRHEENHQHSRTFLEMDAEKNKSLKLKPQQQNMAINIGPSKRPPTNSSGLSDSPLSKKARLAGNISNISARPLIKKVPGAVSRITYEQGGPSSSTTLVGSVPGRSTDSMDAKGDLAPSTSSSNLILSKGKIRASNCNAKDQDRRDDDAKSEIQSLVKHNLKLLSKDKNKLGVDAFKEAARVATHSILAVCGLEHSKSRARFFPRSVCNHSHSENTNTDSTLLPNSCRDCFSSFVKDVVHSLFSEKVGYGR